MQLEVRIAGKRFVHGEALRNVAFGARPGEVLALFGASGSGKTTTLRIALGLDRDFAGTVRRPPGRAGVMFQDPCLLPWMTVAENIRLVAPAGGPVLDPAAALAVVGLPDAMDRMPRELSLGMARRVALARALSVIPSLLVLDEPFASLDALMAATLAGPVARAARENGATVLVATHDLAQTLPIADRILVLAGRPATLAADIPVPRGASTEQLRALRADLLTRFPFMGVGGA